MQKFGSMLLYNSSFVYCDCCWAEKGGFSHFFHCLQDVLLALRWVVSHCLKGDTISNRISVKAVELSTWTACVCFQAMTGAWFNSLLLFDDGASNVGASKSCLRGLCWDGGCWQGKKGIGNSSAKNKKNLGVRGTGERMQMLQCSCAVYHFFWLFWSAFVCLDWICKTQFPAVLGSLFSYL